jgi:hypothetical protein
MRIFLSHANEDKQAAEAIAFSLRSRGHSVFVDRDELPPGDSYDHRIERAVRSSDAFIFLISPASVASGRYTLTELSYARRRWPSPAGRVLPVVIRKTSMDDIPSYLKAVTLLEPLGNITAETSAAIDDLGLGEAARKVAWRFAAAGLIAGAIASFLPFQGLSFSGLSGDFVKPDMGFASGVILAALVWFLGYGASVHRVWLVPLICGLAFMAALTVSPTFSLSGGLVKTVDLSNEEITSKLDQETLDRIRAVAKAAERANETIKLGLAVLLNLIVGLIYLGAVQFALSYLLRVELDWTCLAIGTLMTAVAATAIAVVTSVNLFSGVRNLTILENGSVDHNLALWSSVPLMLSIGLWQASTFGAIGHWLARKAA